MATGTDNRFIMSCAAVAIGVGSVNAVAKEKRLPSTQFLIGSGVAFLIISAMAEAEPDLAKAFAGAIATTVVLGEGGGVLSYINARGEMDTAKRSSSKGRETSAVRPNSNKSVDVESEDRTPVSAPTIPQRRTGPLVPAYPPFRADTVGTR